MGKFKTFEHNTYMEAPVVGIDIIDGHDPFNKAERDNLVNKTKLMLC